MFLAVAVTLICVIGLSVFFTERIIADLEDDLVNNKLKSIKIMSSEAETFFDHLVDTLVLTSMSDVVQDTSYKHLISSDLKGIPQDADLPKRSLAQEILTSNPAFETVAFVLPNGDMYFTEPYSKQQSLTQLNWNHRDWYNGSVSSLKPYISEVYNATATRTYAVSVNVPVFSDSGSFSGLWRSVIDLDELYSSIDYVDSDYLVFFDHKGTELPISLGIFEEDKPRNVIDFKSTKLSLDGQSGVTHEISNNNEFVVSYSPIVIPSHTWGAILVEPSSVVYSEINGIRSQLYILSMVISVAVVLSGLFYYRNTRSRLDIQQELERELEIKNEEIINIERMSAIGHLSSRLAHDIRNPLAMIKGGIELISAKTKNVENLDICKQVDVIHRAIFRISHQIDNVLDFIQKKPLVVKNHKLYKILNSSLDELLIPEKITITKSISDINLDCDANQLQTVFSNIVLNAIQALNNSGKITISGQKTKESTIITISDSGPGVAEKNMAKIFEPLYTTKQSGTGLGLFSCKTIVESHGGSIVYSNNPSTFTICLPNSIFYKNKN